MSDKKGGNDGGFAKFLYNGDTGEVLGRTGSSWAKILIFYVIFYLGLAAFFGLMLYVFYFTLKEGEPKYTLGESLIGTNPGVGFRPQPDQDKNVDSTLIWYKRNNDQEAGFWSDQLKEYLEITKNAGKDAVKCDFGMKANGTCRVEIDNLGPCGGGDFGYKDGAPCVLLKLNKIYEWEPQAIKGNSKDHYKDEHDIDDLDKIEKTLIDSKKQVPDLLRQNMMMELRKKNGQARVDLYKSVWINCEGENPADKENAGPIVYYPGRYISSYYYPFRSQKGYVSPFIMVKFAKPQSGVVINIECKAFAENISPDRQTRTGSVHFELMVD